MAIEYRFEDIVEASDAAMQKALAGVANEILAAALIGAREDVAAKMIGSLSATRRKEVSAAAQAFPPRTREVAKQVVWRAVFGIGEIPEETGQRKDLKSFLEKISSKHPDFIEAKRQRDSALLGEFLRRMIEQK